MLLGSGFIYCIVSHAEFSGIDVTCNVISRFQRELACDGIRMSTTGARSSLYNGPNPHRFHACLPCAKLDYSTVICSPLSRTNPCI